MNTLADKRQENKNQSKTTVVSQKQSSGVSSFQFVNNRPEVVAQRKLQDMINSSLQVKEAAQLQTMANNYTTKQQQSIQKKENNTGLPDNLKSGIENLSGYAMDDVKVHYNSDKPVQLNAHAYAQGTDIHVASGQEKHVPHEAWHVVQQKQGRVKPTMQMKGNVNVNDDDGLEKEADVMGQKAKNLIETNASRNQVLTQLKTTKVIQRNVNLTVIAGNITAVYVDRNNEEGIFGADIGDAGDHTTAHVVFRDMIRNQLLGQTLIAASGILQNLFNATWTLPGMSANDYITDDQRDAVLRLSHEAQQAINVANITPTMVNIQNAAQALLNFRNSVPLSAIEGGGVGAGEGPQAGRLRQAEDALRANAGVDLNTLLGVGSFNGDGTVGEQLQRAVIRLLDTGRVEAEYTDGEPDFETAPGVAGIYLDDRRDIIEQHLRSISMAYPLLWANYLNGVVGNLIGLLETQIELGNYQNEDYDPGSDMDEDSD